jgi:hypothetical protein
VLVARSCLFLVFVSSLEWQDEEGLMRDKVSRVDGLSCRRSLVFWGNKQLKERGCLLAKQEAALPWSASEEFRQKWTVPRAHVTSRLCWKEHETVAGWRRESCLPAAVECILALCI